MINLRGRPRSFDESAVLELAMSYFWEHGYDNASLDNLLGAMKIKKSSFYATFKSKEILFSRVLELYRKNTVKTFIEIKNNIGAKNALLLLINSVVQELQETGNVKGCLLASSAKECYQKYPELSKQVSFELTHISNLFESFIAEAQINKDITSKKSARALAGRYSTTINGLIIMIQGGSTQSLVDDVILSIEELLS